MVLLKESFVLGFFFLEACFLLWRWGLAASGLEGLSLFPLGGGDAGELDGAEQRLDVLAGGGRGETAGRVPEPDDLGEHGAEEANGHWGEGGDEEAGGQAGELCAREEHVDVVVGGGGDDGEKLREEQLDVVEGLGGAGDGGCPLEDGLGVLDDGSQQWWEGAPGGRHERVVRPHWELGFRGRAGGWHEQGWGHWGHFSRGLGFCLSLLLIFFFARGERDVAGLVARHY